MQVNVGSRHKDMWKNFSIKLGKTGACSFSSPSSLLRTKNTQSGFSLIELMVSVGIVAILASVAIPSYISFTRNGSVSEALATLMNLSTRMEKRFVDVGNYGNDGCGITQATTSNYAFSCELDGINYTWTATSVSDGGDYVYTINQDGVRATTKFEGSTATDNCWVLNNSGGCY